MYVTYTYVKKSDKYIVEYISIYLCMCPITNDYTYVFVQPEFQKCWDIFFILIKWKLKDVQITWTNILFTIEHRWHKCLNRDIIHFYPLNELILNLMNATGLTKVGMGATNGWKSKTFWKDSTVRTSSNDAKRLCKSHHLHYITSSKDSEKLEKSLCVRDKAEDLYWISMVFGPSDDTALLISMILSLTLLNGPRNTSRNHCRQTQSAVPYADTN